MITRICSLRCLALLAFIILSVIQVHAQLIYTPYAFTNFAGQPGGPGSADGTGIAARFRGPSAAATDAAGNIYISDQANYILRKITPDGAVTTIAGTALSPGTNDDIGSAARFGSAFGGPQGIAVDSSTNIYVADTANYTIRKITFVGTNWQVTTLAGTPGVSGTNDNTGNAAHFSAPAGITVGPDGNIYVTDQYVVRRVTPAGLVTTLAGSPGQAGTLDASNNVARFGSSFFGGPKGIVVDSQTNIYVTDTYNNTLRKITLIGADWAVTTPAGIASVLGYGNGTNNAASFANPWGITRDNSGNLYIADPTAQTIREVVFSGTNAIVSTIAGTATVSGSLDGTNSDAQFQAPEGMAADSSGNIYVADSGNDEVRKIMPSGTNWIVSTLAGEFGGPGIADGLGHAAQFDIPHGIAIDASSNLYVGDTFNETIRKITPAGLVTTIAGTAGSHGYSDGVGTAQAPQFWTPIGVTADAIGNVYVADTTNQTIRKILPGGIVTTFAGSVGVKGSANLVGTNATFNSPVGVGVDGTGNVYVADFNNRVIRKITPGGSVSLFAGTVGSQNTNDGVGSLAKFVTPASIAMDGSGNLYVADQGGDTIRKILPDGTVSTLAGLGKSSGTNNGAGNVARFSGPMGVAVDAAGNVYVSDTGNQLIRMITPAGSVSTLAGLANTSGTADGTNSVARFSGPRGIAVDNHTNIYVADANNSTIRKLVIQGTNCIVTTFAGTAGQSGSVDAVGTAARFHFVAGLGIDPSGNVYAADRANDDIRMIKPDGTVTTFAGTPQVPGSADGTGAAAVFYGPEDLTVDSTGNVYVVEFFNNTVRKIAPNGTNWIITTVAGCPTCANGTNDGIGPNARFSSPFGLAHDSLGNLYVGDTGNRTIRKIMPTSTNWIVSTYLGAPGVSGDVDATGTAARLIDPHNIAVDSANNLYFTDGNAIRKATSAGAVTTIASCPPPGCVDSLGSIDGPGSTARFDLPGGIAVDAAGNVYVGDTGNDLIREVSPSNGTWNVTTLGGFPGEGSGIDGVGQDARFNQPNGIAVDAAGALYVINTGENNIVKGTVASTTTPPPTLRFDTSAGSLLVSGGNFQTRLIGPSSGQLVLEASTNLKNWVPIQTDSISGNPTSVSVPVSAIPYRFFRAYLLP